MACPVERLIKKVEYKLSEDQKLHHTGGWENRGLSKEIREAYAIILKGWFREFPTKGDDARYARKVAYAYLTNPTAKVWDHFNLEHWHKMLHVAQIPHDRVLTTEALLL